MRCDRTKPAGGVSRMAGTKAAAMACLVLAWPAVAQPAPDYDFQWATIGNVNNPGYSGPTFPGSDFPLGRGSISYTYRLSKLEVTTTQWIEFFNTFTTQSQELSDLFREPAYWGGQSDLTYTGPGQRYELRPLPGAAMFPTSGISWYTAARYCNWLHNDKSSDPAALVTGAYDTTTWGRFGSDGRLMDGEARLPGARFWIPSFDEWVKASHFDPEGNGGAGRWWRGPNRSDELPVSGFPGVGQSSAGTGNWQILLGSYPDQQSAYGLLDTSGGGREWLETIGPQRPELTRLWDGASIADEYLGDDALQSADLAWRVGAQTPGSVGFFGFRVASIPSVSSGLCLVLGAVIVQRRMSRR